MQEVEDALVDYLFDEVLTESVTEQVLRGMRRQVQAQMPESKLDAKQLKADLKTARSAQAKLAKAVALADDIPELVKELHQRSARIRHLEAQLDAAKRSPGEAKKVMKRVEKATREKLTNLREALKDRRDLREVFLALFPNGLVFTPITVKTNRRRRVWQIAGTARLGNSPDCVVTPQGIEPRTRPNNDHALHSSSRVTSGWVRFYRGQTGSNGRGRGATISGCVGCSS